MEKIIKQVLNVLNDAGYQAYLVGGYVRDSLLGQKSYDIDICTNALPKQIHQLFNSSKSNYGSVNIKIDKYNIDITTFRKDANYVNRRPTEVFYIDSLEEDLLRRDFTINAICMDASGKIIDPLGGTNDLNNRIIKMIGDPEIRLKEDPLRIMRAIRFKTNLDFDMDSNLLSQIKKNYMLVGTLSKTRLKSELDHILMSKNFLKGLKLLKEIKIDKVINLEYKELNYVDDLLGMWAQIKVNDMPFTNKEKSNIIKIAEVVNIGKINDKTLYTYGLYICSIAGKILNIKPSNITKIYENLPIKAREDIKVSSEDIKKYVGTGKIIGKTYEELEYLIFNKKLNNNHEDIIEYLKTRK